MNRRIHLFFASACVLFAAGSGCASSSGGEDSSDAGEVDASLDTGTDATEPDTGATTGDSALPDGGADSTTGPADASGDTGSEAGLPESGPEGGGGGAEGGLDAGADASDAGDAAEQPSIFILDKNGLNSDLGATVYGYAANGVDQSIEVFYGNTPILNGWDLAVDGAGFFYILGQSGTAFSIQVFAPGSKGAVTPVRTITTTSPGPGALGGQNLHVLPDGTIYVWTGFYLLTFAPGANGNVTPQILQLDINNPDAGAFYPNLDLAGLTTDSSNAYIGGGNGIGVVPLSATSPFTLLGSDLITGPALGNGSVDTFMPTRLATDPTTGNIWATAGVASCSAGTSVIAFAPAAGPANAVACLQVPGVTAPGNVNELGLTFDSKGRLYVPHWPSTSACPVLDVYPAGTTMGTPTPIFELTGKGCASSWGDYMAVATTL
jgi:hypothetical protein